MTGITPSEQNNLVQEQSSNSTSGLTGVKKVVLATAGVVAVVATSYMLGCHAGQSNAMYAMEICKKLSGTINPDLTCTSGLATAAINAFKGYTNQHPGSYISYTDVTGYTIRILTSWF